MMRRYLYPKEWKHLADAAKEQAGWMCEVCLVQHGELVRSPRTGNRYIVYLQAAHVHHDQHNPHPELKAVCPTCHARYYRRPMTSQRGTALSCKRQGRLAQLDDQTLGCMKTHVARRSGRKQKWLSGHLEPEQRDH